MTTSMESKKLKESLIDLYLNVKIRKEDNVNINNKITIIKKQINEYSENDENTEKTKLEKIPSLTLVEYIKTSIEILVGMKAEELLKERTKKKKKEKMNDSSITEYEDTETSTNEYEKLLRKHEADIRNFIKVINI